MHSPYDGGMVNGRDVVSDSFEGGEFLAWGDDERRSMGKKNTATFNTYTETDNRRLDCC